MRRIKFIKNLGIKEGQGAGPHYDAGKVYSFEGQIPEGYAQAYIDRGFAVDAVDEPLLRPQVQPAPSSRAQAASGPFAKAECAAPTSTGSSTVEPRTASGAAKK